MKPRSRDCLPFRFFHDRLTRLLRMAFFVDAGFPAASANGFKQGTRRSRLTLEGHRHKQLHHGAKERHQSGANRVVRIWCEAQNANSYEYAYE